MMPGPSEMAREEEERSRFEDHARGAEAMAAAYNERPVEEVSYAGDTVPLDRRINPGKANELYPGQHEEAMKLDKELTEMAYKTKDSGAREEFDTGSRRDSREGKGRYDLMFTGMPQALRRLAGLLERGAIKYGERNWEKGQPLSRYLDSALRHLSAVAEGREDEDHQIAAAWNCMAMAETLERIRAGELPAELNDLYR